MYEYTSRIYDDGKAIYWSGVSGYLEICWLKNREYVGPAVIFYTDGKVEKFNYV
jgi:hypothetical protein